MKIAAKCRRDMAFLQCLHRGSGEAEEGILIPFPPQNNQEEASRFINMPNWHLLRRSDSTPFAFISTLGAQVSHRSAKIAAHFLADLLPLFER
jgi:hypothetical protein